MPSAKSGAHSTSLPQPSTARPPLMRSSKTTAVSCEGFGAIRTSLRPNVAPEVWICGSLAYSTLHTMAVAPARLPHALQSLAAALAQCSCTHAGCIPTSHSPPPRTVPSTSRLVVHCLLSQVRGPRCASAIMKRLAAQGRAGQPPVLVLRGGWEEFHAQYGGEGDVVEPL